MAIGMRVRSSGLATVVQVSGVGSDELLVSIAEDLRGVLAPGRAVVIDLDDLVLCDVRSTEHFIAAVARLGSDVRIACGRLSARRLLRRCAVDTPVMILPSVDDALAARYDGFGTATASDEAPPALPTSA